MSLPSIQHLQGLQALLQVLASEGIDMESHQYDGVAFGNFVLVLAKGHNKVRFIWEGRESIFTVERRKAQNKAIAESWEHDAFIKIQPAESVLAEIGSNAEAMLQ